MVLANIFGFGNPVEIAIIAGVVVLLFGGSKIAGFGKNLGEGMKEFKKAAREIHSDDSEPEARSSAPRMMESSTPASENDGTPHTAEATTATAAANAPQAATKE